MNFSGKKLKEIRVKQGYKSRDQFYHSLNHYLDKNNRSNEMLHIKTIQRMENDDSISQKNLSIITEFLNINSNDLIKSSNKVKKAKDQKKLFDFEMSLTSPPLISKSDQLIQLAKKSDKRIFVFDVNLDKAAEYQDKGIEELIKRIDKATNSKKDLYQSALQQNYGSGIKTDTDNLSLGASIQYILDSLKNGYSWVNAQNYYGGEHANLFGLEYVSPNPGHKDVKEEWYRPKKSDDFNHPLRGISTPIYIYAVNLNYLTCWPFPSHHNFFEYIDQHEPGELWNFVYNDIYYPKKEANFDPDSENSEFKIAPVNLSYTIFILSNNTNLDLLCVPDNFSKHIEAELNSLDFFLDGVQRDETLKMIGVKNYSAAERKNFLLNSTYHGSYHTVLNELKNYDLLLDQSNCKLIYGKGGDIVSGATKLTNEFVKSGKIEI